jgi:ATP-dependent Zn protease
MSTHRDQLESLAAALLERETLEQEEAYAATDIELSVDASWLAK